MGSSFRKYDHVERLGHPALDGLVVGKTYIFPKLDGTNASIWLDDGDNVCAGSRTRQLSVERDNAGFYRWVLENEDRIREIIFALNGARLYGEWLVPHTLKTYREDAWRKFWVFDVHHRDLGYVSYDDYFPILDAKTCDGLMVIDPLCTIENPFVEQIEKQVEQNTFLIQDACGVGEGVVIKNYDWRNRYGDQPWGKIVKNEFKEQNKRAFGTPEIKGAKQVEIEIAEKFVTPTLVEKCRAKNRIEMANDRGLLANGIAVKQYDRLLRIVEEENRGEAIPRLLQSVYTDIVREEIYEIVKKHNDPTIDFKKLRQHCIRFTKEYAKDLF